MIGRGYGRVPEELITDGGSLGWIVVAGVLIAITFWSLRK